MSDITSIRQILAIENKQFRDATTESLFQQIGEVINWIIDNVQTEPIGTLVLSSLSEPQYQASSGPGWVLCNGQNVAGTAYAALVSVTAPDFRGGFLRGKNNGRSSATGNPAGEKAIFAGESDKFADHSHVTSYVPPGAPGKVLAKRDNVLRNDRTGPPDQYANDDDSNPISVLVMQDNGVKVSAGGAFVIGTETYPYHITENIFIRVD